MQGTSYWLDRFGVGSRKFFKISLRLSGLATFLSKHTNVCFTSIWSTELFQNSSSSKTVHGLFSRYHWNFLEEFFRQFQTCKLNMKIWDGKNQYILSLLFVNDFLRENRWNCNSPKNTYTNDVELFSRNFKQLGPWNFFK